VSIFFAIVVVMSAQGAATDATEGAGEPAQAPDAAASATDEAVHPEGPQPDAPQVDVPNDDVVTPEPPKPDEQKAEQPKPELSKPKEPPAPKEPKAPQTQWRPLDDEVESMASGMLGVCETLILPISIVPAVGEYIGLAAEWACIVPAAFAVQHTALHHGDRAPHLWQIFIALGAQKLWQTIVALPVPFVLVAAASVGLGLTAIATYMGLPVGISLGLLLSPLTLTYLVSKGLEKEGGRFIFTRMYDLFDEGLLHEEHASAAKESWVGPRQDGIPGVVYLVATADGANAPFEPSFLIPVLGPILKGQAEARTTHARMRRAGVEVLGEAKHDLSGMDSVTDALAGTEAVFMAIGQAGLLASFSMLGVSLLMFQNGDQQNAELFGGLGALGSIFAASFVGLAQIPDALKPCCVPAAYMLAPIAEKYPDPRAGVEIPPPPAQPPMAETPNAPAEAGASTQEATPPALVPELGAPTYDGPSPNPPP
jgi:hypothetical protein